MQAGLESRQALHQRKDGDQAVPENAVAEATDGGERPLYPTALTTAAPGSADRNLDVIQML